MPKVKITALPNGPLMVEGEIEIADAQGQPLDVSGRPKVALCRCGQSSKKPFCDGTHSKCGFRDPAS
jgi:CDGSH-type Zn-finger protein